MNLTSSHHMTGTTRHLLQVSVFEKIQLLCALQPDELQIEPASDANQLILFDF